MNEKNYILMNNEVGMNHNRHGKRRWPSQKNSFQNNSKDSSKEKFKSFLETSKLNIASENSENQKKKEQAIQEFKSREIICPICSKQILDVASALGDKSSGNPVHFECAMAHLEKTETVGQNEKICYIGQGRFGILYFENPRDQRHFTIKKIIEWENRDSKLDWRSEMSSLYSQVL